MEEILKRQLLIRGRAFATFSSTEKALAGRKKSFRGMYVVQACNVTLHMLSPRILFTQNLLSQSTEK